MTAENLVADYDAAKERAESLGRLIRASGHYPLLGGGDINLYSLFVERAMNLVKPDGFVGLLTPSGIYADKTAAQFFKTVSTSGRVGGLFDFENRRLGTDLPPFFKDIHSRRSSSAHSSSAAPSARSTRPSAPSSCTTPRPSTRPQPLLPTFPRRLRAGEPKHRHRPRLPHSTATPTSPAASTPATPCWWIAQAATRTTCLAGQVTCNMFDMTNDSHRFRTAAQQLEDEGFYPVQGNHWKRGADTYVPLYEGKMVQAFDHRAASVVVNPENLKPTGAATRNNARRARRSELVARSAVLG